MGRGEGGGNGGREGGRERDSGESVKYGCGPFVQRKRRRQDVVGWTTRYRLLLLTFSSIQTRHLLFFFSFFLFLSVFPISLFSGFSLVTQQRLPLALLIEHGISILLCWGLISLWNGNCIVSLSDTYRNKPNKQTKKGGGGGGRSCMYEVLETNP